MSRKFFKQGYYQLQNPHKYVGDPAKVRYMSSYELQSHQFFDNNPNVLRWGAEVVRIPYLKPTTGKIHTYIVDYFVEYITKEGEVVKELIEVKPHIQTKAPTGSSKTDVYAQLTYSINVAKWEAAKKYCQDNDMNFRLLTERSLFA